MDLIETVFEQSGQYHDRYFGETFTLPYSFDAIQIQPNELVTYRTLNDSLEKLYHNFTYLYGLTRVSSNTIPDALSGIAAVSGANTFFQWYTTNVNTSSFATTDSAGLYQYDSIRKMDIAYSSIFNSYLLFSGGSSNLIVTSTDATTTFAPIISATYVTTNSQLQFGNITSIKIADTYLFVLDSVNSSLYRYNISGLLSNDVFASQLIVDKIIGGTGSFQDRYEFSSPSSMCIYGKHIYVLDAGNYTVKVYDFDFNFIAAYQLKQDLLNTSPTDIICDTDTGEFIIVTATGLIFKYSNTFDFIEKHSMVLNIPEYASIQNVFVSKSFKNVYYIVTAANIYKLYMSKPGDIIGKFSLYRFNNTLDGETFLTAESVSTGDADFVFIFSNGNYRTKVLLAVDTPNLVSVLTDDNFDVYSLDDIKCSPGEYVQTWVITKAIMKLLLNHLRLKDKIKGRFTGVYDKNNNPLLAGTLYFLLDDLDLTSYDITPEHVLGNNEALTSAAVNRGLEKIYNIQTAILEKSNTVVQDSSYFKTQPVILT